MREEWTSASGIGILRGYAYSGAAEHREEAEEEDPLLTRTSPQPSGTLRCDATRRKMRRGTGYRNCPSTH